MNERMRKALAWPGHLLVLLAVIASILFVSYHIGLWHPYPQGNDATSHIFRASIVLKYFPSIDWIHSWVSGMPMFYAYPFIPYILVALFSNLGKIPVGLSLQIMAIAALVMSAMAVYAIVRLLTQNYISALSAALLFSLIPGAYTTIFTGGTYARGMSIVFVPMTFLFLIIYFKRREGGLKTNWALALTILSIFGAFLFHYMGGVFVSVLAAFLILIAPGTRKDKIKLVFLIFLAVFLLSFFSLVRILLYPQYLPPEDAAAIQHLQEDSMGLGYIFNFSFVMARNARFYRFAMPPGLGLLLVVVAVVTFFLYLKRIKDTLVGRVIIWLSLLIPACLVYELFLIKWGWSYRYFGGPSEMFPYLAILFSVFLGITSSFFYKKLGSILLLALVLLGIIFWIPNQFPLLPLDNLRSLRGIQASVYEPDKWPVLTRIFERRPNSFNERFGADDDGTIGVWFNVRYPAISQSRGYYSNGILGIDYFVYFYQSLWDWVKNYPETDFNLDWWAIRAFINTAKTESGKTKKYDDLPDKYQPLGEEAVGAIQYFENRAFVPIMSPSNSLSIMVGGKDKISYDSIFRSLAQNNWNSEYFVPVKAPSSIDKMSQAQLEKFDLIFLYGYEVRNPKTIKNLKKFVEDGGALIIESNKYVDEEKMFGDLLPVSSIESRDFGKEWSLTKGPLGAEIISDIDLGKFGPAVYNGTPWGVSVGVAKNSTNVLVSNYGRPIIVGSQIGKGRVIWSGMNMPYHIDMYKSQEESKMLGELLYWARGKSMNSPNGKVDNSLYDVKFINPQKWVVTLNKPAKGVLFKESYFLDWQARVKTSKGWQKAYVYRAGPDFMYVSLKEFKNPKEVVFEFKKSPLELATIGISFLTLLGLIAYGINDSWLSRIKDKFVGGKNLTEIQKWWESDKEE